MRLEDLDRVDWTRLSHAYGHADAVPRWIRDLASSDDATREQAGRGLANTLVHCGSRYPATAPAVPYLFEILEAPGIGGRVPLIRMLVQMAVADPGDHLPFGFDPAKEFALADELGRTADLDAIRAAPPGPDDEPDPAICNLWERDAYEAVLAGVEVFRRLASDPDGDVRRAAVKALAWLPGAAAGSIPTVRQAARSAADPGERANATLSLGLLAQATGDRSDVPWLVDRLRTDPGPGPGSRRQ